MAIERLDKIGLGTWDRDNRGSALNSVDSVGFSWHYNWNERTLWDSDDTPERSEWVGMVWDESDVTPARLAQIVASGATTLLGFNEPNLSSQAHMSVGQALNLWGQLQGTGLRLGSPAASQDETLGANSWLGRFMAGVEARGLRVDFIAVHYYSEDGDVGAFRDFLEAVHRAYGKPIWVTEWAMADWDNPSRFSEHQQAAFARAGIEMLDDLSFVERHAWFAGYEGGDGWHLNSGVFRADGTLTEVGRVFADLLDGQPDIVGTEKSDRLVGGVLGEAIQGLEGADRLAAGGGNDVVRGGSGNDTLGGGLGADQLIGGRGADSIHGGNGADKLIGGDGYDLLRGGAGQDLLWGGAGADTFSFTSGSGGDRVMDFTDNVDSLQLDATLWGDQALSANQVLQRFARVDDGDVLFEFANGQTLRIEGLDSVAALRDDIGFI